MSMTKNATLSPEEFKFAFRGHPAGVGIVTADDGNGPAAMTVSSLFSVGLEPPTLVFSTSPLSSATPTILASETVVVHMVSADQIVLAKLCATNGADRFGSGVSWGRLPTGEPYYPGAEAWIRGRVTNRVEACGSTLVVVEALECKQHDAVKIAKNADLSPLVYHNRTWHRIGEHSQITDA